MERELSEIEKKVAISMEKNKIIVEFIRRGNETKARELIQQILDDENELNETKAIMKSHLIKMAINNENYDEAIRLGEEALNLSTPTNRVSLRQKVAIKSQLIEVARLKEDYGTAITIGREILENGKVKEKQKLIIKKQLFEVAVEEKNYDTTITLGKELLSCSELDERFIARIEEQLGFAIIRSEQRKRDERKLEELLGKEDAEQFKKSAIYGIYKGNNFDRNRDKLYAGEFKAEDLEKIAEENSDTFGGHMFIAEACKYFGLVGLGIKSLNVYLGDKSNNLTASEKQAISKAKELLKDKTKRSQFRSSWDTVYATLGKGLRNDGETR